MAQVICRNFIKDEEFIREVVQMLRTQAKQNEQVETEEPINYIEPSGREGYNTAPRPVKTDATVTKEQFFTQEKRMRESLSKRTIDTFEHLYITPH